MSSHRKSARFLFMCCANVKKKNKTLHLFLLSFSWSMHFLWINQMQFQSGLCLEQSKWSYNAGVVPETIAVHSKRSAILRAPPFLSVVINSPLIDTNNVIPYDLVMEHAIRQKFQHFLQFPKINEALAFREALKNNYIFSLKLIPKNAIENGFDARIIPSLRVSSCFVATDLIRWYLISFFQTWKQLLSTRNDANHGKCTKWYSIHSKNVFLLYLFGVHISLSLFPRYWLQRNWVCVRWWTAFENKRKFTAMASLANTSSPCRFLCVWTFLYQCAHDFLRADYFTKLQIRFTAYSASLVIWFYVCSISFVFFNLLFMLWARKSLLYVGLTIKVFCQYLGWGCDEKKNVKRCINNKWNRVYKRQRFEQRQKCSQVHDLLSHFTFENFEQMNTIDEHEHVPMLTLEWWWWT